MKIKWIGQSGYIIQTETTEIMIDPYLSDAVNRVANCPRLVETPVQPEEVKSDAVICTHNHLDHLDVDAVPRMNKSLLFITTNEGVNKLADMGYLHTKALNVGESVRVGDVEIIAAYAKHTVEAFGVIVKAESKTLYFSGDTLYDEGLFGIAEYQPDVTFICINGRLGNMNVEEAVITARQIGAKVNVPNHYAMFASNTENPEKFTDKLENGFIMEFNTEYVLLSDNGSLFFEKSRDRMKRFTFQRLEYILKSPDRLGEKNPAIIFLHGAGTRGRDINALENNPFFANTSYISRSDCEFLVFAPQCYEDSWFDIFEQLQDFTKMVASHPLVDTDRIYLIGASMGGYATWQLAMTMPDYFAAIVPICGGGMSWNTGRLKYVPVWAFHGKDDHTVLTEESIRLVDAVNKSGGSARLTLLDEVGHNSWEYAYAHEELFDWLLQQKKENITQSEKKEFAGSKAFG